MKRTKKIVILLALLTFSINIGCITPQLNNPEIKNTIAGLDELITDLQPSILDSKEVKYEKKYKLTIAERAKADLIALDSDNQKLAKAKDKSEKEAKKNSNKAYLVNFFIGFGIFILAIGLILVVIKVLKKFSIFGL